MRLIWYVALALAIALPPLGKTYAADDGIVRIKSAFSMPETIKRLKKDVADKGIMLFDEIDQSKLAADAGVTLRASTLLVFGNPPLGTLFLTERRRLMFMRSSFSVALLVSALMLSPSGAARAAVDDGIVRIKSAYSMPETIKR